MLTSRTRPLLTSVLAGTSALVLGSGAAFALTASAPQKITPSGVGAVKLGKTFAQLRAAHLIGPLGPGCEFAGQSARSASLRAPLKGSVDFTQMTTGRRVAAITVRGGAKARGVGIGASTAKVKQAFPKAVVDHSTDATFAITLVKVPKSGGGRLQFAVDTTTHKVTLIGIPNILFCE
ncbi:MAG: hypothetical protein QOJ63_1759 [Solirubrobacteraceae bacterium]|jgi:hypothetical protein|nr:hypothetical protein [Solirubrobacteraceae bacterium]